MLNLINKKLFVISREFADIAEAGGVKNVAHSLSLQGSKKGFDVTLFIPQYGCTSLEKIKNYKKLSNYSTTISINHCQYEVEFAQGYFEQIRVIFIISPYFLSKLGVYTYTKEEEQINPNHRSGIGHEDALFMDVLFQKSILEYTRLAQDFPNIVHCHDAAASLLPFFANVYHQYNEFYKNVKFFVTIHNAGPGYHHEFYNIDIAMSLTELSYNDLSNGLLNECIEPYLLAIPYSTMTTVSPWYAEEILDSNNPFTGGLSKEFSKRNTKIIGITNGIDYDRYDPKNNKISLLNYTYDPESLDMNGKYLERKDFLEKFNHFNDLKNVEQFGNIDCDENAILFCYHGRLVWQKGLDIFADTIELVLNNCDNARFIVIGQGQKDLEDKNMYLSKKYLGKFLYFRGYEKFLARESVAVSDYIVLPSIFEPCGLEDLIAQIFGTIPIASATGGLKKINDQIDGFLYSPNDPQNLYNLINQICNQNLTTKDNKNKMIMEGAKKVHNHYSWEYIFNNYYLPLFCNIF